MKKKREYIIIIAVILLIIILICVFKIKENSKKAQTNIRQNLQYEQYCDTEILGADVITLINKAISENEANKVTKDEKGFFINNNENSVNIEIIMITNEEKLETTRYKMETISKVGIREFIKNFGTTKFKCTNKKYHSGTKKIAYIEITQQPE